MSTQHTQGDYVVARIDGGINIISAKTGYVIWETPDPDLGYSFEKPAPNPAIDSPAWQDALCRAAAPLLLEALEKAKIPHYECESDPYFSCLKSESSRDYYDDPNCRQPSEIICTCGADEHNEAIDIAVSAAKMAS